MTKLSQLEKLVNNTSGNISGPSSSRPTIPLTGFTLYYDETLGKLLYGRAGHWYDLTGSQVADYVSGVSSPGGGINNLADHSDPNNAYLATVFA